MRLHTPAHHLPAKQIQNHGQIQPTLVGRDVGDVTRPHLIGGCCREVALQQVLGNGQLVFAVGGDHELSLAPGFDTVLLHHAPHALLADTDASGHQFLSHLGPAVLLLDLGVDGPDMGQQGFIADALVGARPGWLLSAFAPHVLEEAAGAHAQHVTGERYRPVLLVPLYPGVLHFETRAKYAVAFPRMSRSIRSLAFSARSLAKRTQFSSV